MLLKIFDAAIEFAIDAPVMAGVVVIAIGLGIAY
jgi:hypothetical protein